MFLKRSVHQNTLRLFASALIAFLVLVCRGNKWRGIRKRMMPGSYHQMWIGPARKRSTIHCNNQSKLYLPLVSNQHVWCVFASRAGILDLKRIWPKRRIFSTEMQKARFEDPPTMVLGPSHKLQMRNSVLFISKWSKSWKIMRRNQTKSLRVRTKTTILYWNDKAIICLTLSLSHKANLAQYINSAPLPSLPSW